MTNEEQLQSRIQELEKELAEIRQYQAEIGIQIRAILVPIKGFARTLIDDENEEWYTREDRQDFSTIIDENVDRLSRVLDEYLPETLSELEIVLAMTWQENIDIRAILEEVIERKQRSTDRHQIVLDFEAERITIETDPKQFAVIFHGLIGNAIKYALHGGEIKITVRTEPSNQIDTVENLLIEIYNSGVGLSKAQLKSVGEKFIGRLPSIAPPSGLALAGALIKEHHGTIEHDSEGIDRGVTMSVRIPLQQAKDVANPTK